MYKGFKTPPTPIAIGVGGVLNYCSSFDKFESTMNF